MIRSDHKWTATTSTSVGSLKMHLGRIWDPSLGWLPYKSLMPCKMQNIELFLSFIKKCQFVFCCCVQSMSYLPTAVFNTHCFSILTELMKYDKMLLMVNIPNFINTVKSNRYSVLLCLLGIKPPDSLTKSLNFRELLRSEKLYKLCETLSETLCICLFE